MDRPRPKVPRTHGDMLVEPSLDQWPALLQDSIDNAGRWDFHVAGVPVARFRDSARTEAIARAVAFSRRFGLATDSPDISRVVMTGHQPEFYHPGVWIKNFALEHMARTTSSLAVNLVVDTDAFESVEMTTPCAAPELQRCVHRLVTGDRNGCYAMTEVPTRIQLDDFVSQVESSLETLQAPDVRDNFSAFSSALKEVAPRADNVSELITFARRHLEAAVPTTYLELPVTELASTPTFMAFAIDIARNARRFADAYNTELAEYRSATKTRDRTQPFPDLELSDSSVELPFWLLEKGRRRTARVLQSRDGEVLAADDEPLARLDDSFSLPEAMSLAPKALTLTLYARMFLADLLIHGVGGGRYDRVTTGVGRRFYGVAPTAFVVTSMTMHLPLGQGASVADELARARQDVRRLEFNPDEFVADAEFEDPEQKARASTLSAQKSELKQALSAPDADRRALGSRIKEVNTELAELLQAHERALRTRISSLEIQESELRILNDRTYPFCLWDPREVARNLL